MNPYSTLGVQKNADADAIKRAHRKAAKRTHPDSGGTKEEFQAVNSAYMVLRDPLRRERYDRTGDESDTKDTTVTELIRLFVQVAGNCTEHDDPVVLTRRNIEGIIATIESNRKDALREAIRLTKTAKRVKVRSGHNLLATALENQAATMQRQADAMQEAHERGQKMLELLAGYDFEMPEQEATFTFGGAEFKGRVTAWPAMHFSP